jgi:hypothetical protein
LAPNPTQRVCTSDWPAVTICGCVRMQRFCASDAVEEPVVKPNSDEGLDCQTAASVPALAPGKRGIDEIHVVPTEVTILGAHPTSSDARARQDRRSMVGGGGRCRRPNSLRRLTIQWLPVPTWGGLSAPKNGKPDLPARIGDVPFDLDLV